jgi:hypothetical protein
MLTLCSVTSGSGNIFFFYFVHRLYFNKFTFRKVDLLQSSGKNGKKETLDLQV